jgi:hypothetical protein
MFPIFILKPPPPLLLTAGARATAVIAASFSSFTGTEHVTVFISVSFEVDVPVAEESGGGGGATDATDSTLTVVELATGAVVPINACPVFRFLNCTVSPCEMDSI